MSFKPTNYHLVCVADGNKFEDTGWSLNDPNCKVPSLIRAEYEEKRFKPREDLDGLYRYANWLPIHKTLSGSCAPKTYKSKALAKELSLSNLYITFSGYWPKIGAHFETCSFKETEAYSVCGKLGANDGKTLVLASAGNTARAFAKVCSENNIPIVITIPEDNLNALWFTKELNDCVKIIATPTGSEYYDAILLSEKICTSPKYFPEGGAKNVARRDGMGTTLLSAVEVIGRIPDAYFQAVGSGTGAMAAWENNLRLIKDGRYGSHKMRVYPSQNAPFTLLYDSWKAGSRQLVDISQEDSRNASATIKAKVLANRKPPYAVAGGLYDCLVDSNGDMFSVTNEELDLWSQKFLELEGIDIHPAAAVTVASLAQAVKSGVVSKDEVIMVNITGGGEELLKSERKVIYAKPSLILDSSLSPEEILAAIE